MRLTHFLANQNQQLCPQLQLLPSAAGQFHQNSRFSDQSEFTKFSDHVISVSNCMFLGQFGINSPS